MRSWSVRKFVILMLAVFVTTGLTFSAARASAMAARMTTVSTMGVSDRQDCPDCSGNADKMKQMACLAACIAPASVAAPDATGSNIHPTSSGHPLSLTTLLLGSTLPPDPYPPRTIDIG